MRDCQKWLILYGVLSLLTSYVHAESLTPPYEPRDNRFYVCYEERRINYTVHTVGTRLLYHKFSYHGCMISRKSCCHLKRKKSHGEVIKLKPFGMFNNYPQTLNAFYRCAYS